MIKNYTQGKKEACNDKEENKVEASKNQSNDEDELSETSQIDIEDYENSEEEENKKESEGSEEDKDKTLREFIQPKPNKLWSHFEMFKAAD